MALNLRQIASGVINNAKQANERKKEDQAQPSKPMSDVSRLASAVNNAYGKDNTPSIGQAPAGVDWSEGTTVRHDETGAEPVPIWDVDEANRQIAEMSQSNTQGNNSQGKSTAAALDSNADLLPVLDATSGFFKTPEQREKDKELLHERSQFMPGYRMYREDFMDNGGNYNDMMSFRDWSQNEIDNGSWLATEGVNIEGGDQAANMNAFMNNTPEGQAYLESIGMEPGEWDFYNDYAIFAQDGSDAAKNAWAAWYSDPSIAPVYYQQLGEAIDTDKNGEISRKEAEDYWDLMNQYHPETMDPFSDDEMMQRVYGFSSTGPSVYAMDAWNNHLGRDQVLQSLINGTYADDVASGRINALVDSSGKDMVETLGMDRLAEEYANLQGLVATNMATDEDLARLDEVEAELYDKSARYNNALGAAQWADYKSENPEGQYDIDWGYYHGTPDMLAQLGAGAGYEDGEIDQMLRDYNQARGWTERYNNIAGGDSGVTFRRAPDEGATPGIPEDTTRYLQAISDMTNTDLATPAYYDPATRTLYRDQITEAGDNTLADLSGTTAISPDLAYLTAQGVGLTDRGWNVYGGGAQLPEYHQAAPKPRESEFLLFDQDSPEEIRSRMYTEEQIANAVPGNQQNSMIRRNEYLEQLAQKAEVQEQKAKRRDTYERQLQNQNEMHGGINWEETSRARLAGFGVTIYNDGAVVDPSGASAGYLSSSGSRNSNPENWNVGA